jgi:hypothetical protein
MVVYVILSSGSSIFDIMIEEEAMGKFQQFYKLEDINVFFWVLVLEEPVKKLFLQMEAKQCFVFILVQDVV